MKNNDYNFDDDDEEDTSGKDTRDISGGEKFGENFTLVSDALTQEFGIIISATFGYIYRKALKEGYSFCSKNSISDGLKCSPKSVRVAIEVLENKNLIVNVTPPEYVSKTQVQYYSPIMENFDKFYKQWEQKNKNKKKINADKIVDYVKQRKAEKLRSS